MTTMNPRNIFESIRAKQLLSELNWCKYYYNGASLFEYKVYEQKSKKPIAFIQLCKDDITGNIIGLSVTSVNDIQNPIDCETLTQFERTLDNIIK